MSTPGARNGRLLDGRLVDAALRCYPPRWRRRHGAEAAELAALLIRDGRPAVSIAWSYLLGAARAWLTPRPGRSLSAVAAALLAAACLLGFAAALAAETTPARAASTTQSPSPHPVTPHQATRCRSIQGTAHARSC